jgi:membrane fusion protein, copper/silver efflux system
MKDGVRMLPHSKDSIMKNFIAGFLAAAVLLTLGYFVYTRESGNAPRVTTEQAKPKYHCPMHPTFVSDKMGNCPICGMKLVPIESVDDSASAKPHTGHESTVPGYASVMIPNERIQSMGITLAEARRMELDQSMRTFGRVTYDETKVHHVHTKFEGYIETLYVNYIGQFVKKGESLFTIYSPELFATQSEYLLALRAREQMPELSGNDELKTSATVDLVAAARQRLSLWDIEEKDVRELEKTRKPIRALTIFSPVSGYVTEKAAFQGLKVSPGDNLYDIVDLSAVWVLADIYEVNLPFIHIGQTASMTLAYQPGKTWHGRVTFINPTLDPVTRTVKARLEFANPNNELKPDMYADVVIGGAGGTGLAVPESAVIATGERNIVFVAAGEGMFEPREVVLGARVRNFYEIRKGVSEGEMVVTGANFLLDSESKLKAAISSGSGEHSHGS